MPKTKPTFYHDQSEGGDVEIINYEANQFLQVKIIFPDRNEGGQNCVVTADLFGTGDADDGRADRITLADGCSWPPGWSEEDTDHLRKCCNVFCSGQLADAVLSVELDCGIKIERIENEIE
tara:strand:+ start:3534 stop:3896 length:363 start_codon:yes stop_codon:yes gene_type:complete